MQANLLHQIHRAANQEWARSAREIGVSFSEFEYLSAIHEEAERQRYDDAHGQHLQDIVETLGVAKASASAMVAKLEERKLVLRFQCERDARAQHIVLTPEGAALMKRGLKVYERLAKKFSQTRKAQAVKA